MNTAILFVGCLAGALAIHAMNQRHLEEKFSPRAAAWALCSRQLCTAAAWAALAAGFAGFVAVTSLLPALYSGTGDSSSQTLAMAMSVLSSIAQVVSMLIALKAVSTLVPRFELGAVVSTEPADSASAVEKK